LAPRDGEDRALLDLALQSIDGKGLPYTFSDGNILTAMTVVMNDNGTYTTTSTYSTWSSG